MNLRSGQFLKILYESGMVQQTAARLPVNEQIKIALLVRFAAHHGPENAQVARPATVGEAENLFAMI